MIHVTQRALWALWHSLEKLDMSEFRPEPNSRGCDGAEVRPGMAVSGLSMSEIPTVTCPECRRLVWLATGERELGDGIE